MSTLIFDTETTGLPKTVYNWKNSEDFDTARLVSISWIIDNPYKQVYHIIQPENFRITKESIDIHGITEERAKTFGISFNDMIKEFYDDLKNVNKLVAHNIEFDFNIMLNELNIRNMNHIITEFLKKDLYCTKQQAKIKLNLEKSPRLSELYTLLFEKPIINAHDAMYDTLHCYQCYKKLQELK